MWKRKRAREHEAYQVYADAQAKSHAALQRESQIQELSAYFAARRKRNHFGDSLTMSFTPRRSP